MHRQTVLVIDDNRARCEGYAELLQMHGFLTYAAFAGAEGLALANELRPDALLLDLHMPGVSGLQVIAAVRGDPSMNHIAIVLLTGEAFSGATYGSDAFLTFPVTVNVLTNVLRGTIAKRRNFLSQ